MAWYDVANYGFVNKSAAGPVYGYQKVYDTTSHPWYAFAGQGVAQGWGTSGLADPSDSQRILFDTNPDLVNQQLGNWLAPNQQSHFRQYVDATTPEMYKDFSIYSADHPNSTYSEFMGQHWGDLVRGFGELSATQRGENPMAFNAGVAGRNVFR